MAESAITHTAPTRTAAEVIRSTQVQQAANGVCFAQLGETGVNAGEIERIINAIPRPIAAALERKAFYFVPLAVSDEDETLIAERYDVGLSDRAVCHRNYPSGDSQCIFISTRLMDDKFSVAFELYINVGHAFVDRAGISAEFSELAWRQVNEKVRGESSLDAHELRRAATTPGADAEKAKHEYFQAVFSDAIAIYMLSLSMDVDYYELREREYPLLAPAALAERLRKVNELFPPNPGYEFSILHRRRS